MALEVYSFNLDDLTEEEAAAFEVRLKEEIKNNPNFFKEASDHCAKMVADRKRVYPNIRVKKDELIDGEIWIVTLLKRAGWIESSSEGFRIIKQGAVSIRGLHITEPEDILVFDGNMLHCGKKSGVIVVESWRKSNDDQG